MLAVGKPDGPFTRVNNVLAEMPSTTSESRSLPLPGGCFTSARACVHAVGGQLPNHHLKQGRF